MPSCENGAFLQIQIRRSTANLCDIVWPMLRVLRFLLFHSLRFSSTTAIALWFHEKVLNRISYDRCSHQCQTVRINIHGYVAVSRLYKVRVCVCHLLV